MFFIFVVGTAGSGKSLLTASFQKWLAGAGFNAGTVNLDPGVDSPPYSVDVDIRDYVDYDNVVKTFGLGPNGALVACLDMAVNYVADLREEILAINSEYALVDCPGQMELFAYRNSGPLMVNGLRGQESALSAYLLDSNIARTPEGYLSSMLLGLSINIRFGIPQLNILSKPDILTPGLVDEIVEWSTDPYTLEDTLGNSSEGLTREFSQAVLGMLDGLGGATSLLPVSARSMNGMDELYGEVQRIFMGGENIQ
jgi:GTPase SAR1 family protein